LGTRRIGSGADAGTRPTGAGFANSIRRGKMPLHNHHEFNELDAPDGQAHSGGEKGLDRDSCGFALQDGTGDAYNEEAFHYFLEIERKRSELSNRPFLLMLIEFNRHHPGVNPEIDGATAARLFPILSQCVRETDFIGWYREGRVVGAVLTQHGEPDRDDLSEVVRQRVADALDKHFPPDRPRSLQVRVYQLSPNTKLRSE
jgi:hypothetical protein